MSEALKTFFMYEDYIQSENNEELNGNEVTAIKDRAKEIGNLLHTKSGSEQELSEMIIEIAISTAYRFGMIQGMGGKT